MKKPTPRNAHTRKKSSAPTPPSNVLPKPKTAETTVAHSSPLRHLRDAAVKVAKDTRDDVKAVARKTGRAAHEGADGIVEAVKEAARNAVHKVAAALDEAVADPSPKTKARLK